MVLTWRIKRTFRFTPEASAAIDAEADRLTQREGREGGLLCVRGTLTQMITKPEVVPMLLEVCPTVRARWAEHLAAWKGEEAGSFNDVSLIAHHIVDSYAHGVTAEFAPLFTLVERIIEEGDEQARQLATIGVLEDIQVISTHHPFGPDAFLQWLGPRSREAWDQIEALWASGGGSLAGVVRVEQGLSVRRKWWQFWK